MLIAAGVGVTPMMSVLRYLTARSWPGEIFFLFCCRTERDYIFREEIEYLTRRHDNLEVFVTMSREDATTWKGPRGRLTKEVIASQVPDIAGRCVHVCGPKSMMDAVANALADLGVPAERIKMESFGGAKKPASREAPPSGQPGVASTVEQSSAPTLTFSVSDKTARLPPDKTILDVAEEIGVDIDSSCREGTCGTCMVKLASGDVTMEVDDALGPEEREQGYVLACQAKATADVVVEA